MSKQKQLVEQHIDRQQGNILRGREMAEVVLCRVQSRAFLQAALSLWKLLPQSVLSQIVFEY